MLETAWTPERRDLWRRIEAHPLQGEADGLDLARQLTVKKGWDRPYAEAAILEYRRFCFLALVAPIASPSEEVDEVWHLHMQHSRDYWDRWCAQALQAKLHHDPAEGKPGEAEALRLGYARTLAHYEGYFGEPPEAFWPGTNRRFGKIPRFRTVDGECWLILPRPRLPRFTGIAGAGLAATILLVAMFSIPAAALPLGPLDWDGPRFLHLYIWLVFALLPAVWLARQGVSLLAGAINRAQVPQAIDPASLAYLAGGKARACDAAIIYLVNRGAATISPYRSEIRPGPLFDDLPPVMKDFHTRISWPVSRRHFVLMARPALRRLRHSLVERGLLAPRLLASLPLALPLGLALFGAAKIALGITRDRPVLGLVVLVLFTLGLTIACALGRPVRTPAGNRLIQRYRQRQRRAGRAPLRSELATAVALGGTTLLVATPFAAYAQIRTGGSGGGNGCGGGGGGGSSGCGGGGGGCGGCSS